MARPARAYPLVDMDPYVAVVRCADGDVDTFTRLAVEEVSRDEYGFDLDTGWGIAAPIWRWFRINPCGGDCGEHSWHIDERYGPGNGVWRGAFVRLERKRGVT